MKIEKAYQLAREMYAGYGVDTANALKRLAGIRISLHCWQGDDISGFSARGGSSSGGEPSRGNLGGVLPTGNYPGKARTPEELRSDLAKALGLIPGRHRVSLHSIYAETKARPADRDELAPDHFAAWVAWARTHKLGLDFNGTFFSHPLAESGRTLSHPDRAVRRFWIDHARACRRIGAFMGRQQKTPCVTNIWVPDGSKDTPADRKAPRELLKQSLDEIFKEKCRPAHNLDSLEGKLFGLGSEAYVAGSHDFYLAYAVAHRKLLCMDTGHFHPTESVADKLTAVLSQLDQVLLHVSRGVRWDSDHVVTLTDDLRSLAEEIVRGNYLQRVYIGLDFFDASINRIAAWVIGARAMLQALLIALVEPTDTLRQMELKGDFTARLALMEELKSLPFGAVWNYYCLQQDVPPNHAWMREVKAYETAVQFQRR
ncbi:MAG: L-rhamnose isomerase [Kiritimatiellae bacterium]|nr:L-rhamnose isomerase [Kiritimatiellia bacterium]